MQISNEYILAVLHSFLSKSTWSKMTAGVYKLKQICTSDIININKHRRSSDTLKQKYSTHAFSNIQSVIMNNNLIVDNISLLNICGYMAISSTKS